MVLLMIEVRSITMLRNISSLMTSTDKIIHPVLFETNVSRRSINYLLVARYSFNTEVDPNGWTVPGLI